MLELRRRVWRFGYGLESHNGVIMLSEYGGSRERWTYTQHIRYEQQQFLVIGYEANTFDNVILNSFGYALDLTTLNARRTYSSGKSSSDADDMIVRFKTM